MILPSDGVIVGVEETPHYLGRITIQIDGEEIGHKCSRAKIGPDGWADTFAEDSEGNFYIDHGCDRVAMNPRRFGVVTVQEKRRER